MSYHGRVPSQNGYFTDCATCCTYSPCANPLHPSRGAGNIRTYLGISEIDTCRSEMRYFAPRRKLQVIMAGFSCITCRLETAKMNKQFRGEKELPGPVCLGAR